MKAHFNAYDEFLWFRADSDIENVYVDFRVYRHSVINLPGGGRSWVVDYDKLRENADAYGYTNIQLGTPDGSGDIAEGRRVQFRICGDPDGGSTKCGAWAYGRS